MSRTIRTVLDEANPNKLADALHALPAGTALGLLPRTEVLPVVAGIATPSVPAAMVAQAYSRNGGIYLNGTAPETVAGAGQITTTPDGRLSVDPACTEVEATYIAVEGVVVTETLQVTGSTATFLAGKHSQKVLSVNVDAGIIPGGKTLVTRGTPPAAGEAALIGSGAGLILNAADVVNGQVTVTYVALPSRTVSEVLEGPTNL